MGRKKIAIVDDNSDYCMYIKRLTEECFEYPETRIFQKSE